MRSQELQVIFSCYMRFRYQRGTVSLKLNIIAYILRISSCLPKFLIPSPRMVQRFSCMKNLKGLINWSEKRENAQKNNCHRLWTPNFFSIL
jgi:hypothetical protein